LLDAVQAICACSILGRFETLNETGSFLAVRCIEHYVPKRSAGILMYKLKKKRGSELYVFLVHPGGPFWKNKDAGAWSIPKGEYGDEENPLAAAQREFQEETGFEVNGEFLPLGEIVQPSGKVVVAWALEGDCLAEDIRSNTFSMEWPPRSGRRQDFPEVDRAAWFDLEEARTRILPGQAGFLDRLAKQVQPDD
jgi:predicted NUDIX family NTP pyrophosphohydrolase